MTWECPTCGETYRDLTYYCPGCRVPLREVGPPPASEQLAAGVERLCARYPHAAEWLRETDWEALLDGPAALTGGVVEHLLAEAERRCRETEGRTDRKTTQG